MDIFVENSLHFLFSFYAAYIAMRWMSCDWSYTFKVKLTCCSDCRVWNLLFAAFWVIEQLPSIDYKMIMYCSHISRWSLNTKTTLPILAECDIAQQSTSLSCEVSVIFAVPYILTKHTHRVTYTIFLVGLHCKMQQTKYWVVLKAGRLKKKKKSSNPQW